MVSPIIWSIQLSYEKCRYSENGKNKGYILYAVTTTPHHADGRWNLDSPQEKRRSRIIIDIGGIRFEGPFQMDVWNPPRKAAVYAIMTKQDDPTDRPASYLPIYIGQSENLDDRGFLRSHHKFGCWIREAGSTGNLFIAVRPMPNSTEADRQRIENQLISKYTPVCND